MSDLSQYPERLDPLHTTIQHKIFQLFAPDLVHAPGKDDVRKIRAKHKHWNV